VSRSQQAIAAVAAILVLGGCGSDGGSGESANQPTSNPTPSPTATAEMLANAWTVGSVVSSEAGVPDEHVVLRSFDGGHTWIETFRGDASLAGISFADRRNGWAVGVDEVLRSEDSGATWVSQRSRVPVAILQAIAVLARSSLRAIVVGGRQGTALGAPSLILVTNDGGQTWTEAPITGGQGGSLDRALLRAVCVSEADIGIAVGRGISDASATVVRTLDGGATWHDITNLVSGGGAGSLLNLNAVGCVGQNLWIVGQGTRQIVHSADGGMTWEDQTANIAPSGAFALFGTAFANATTGFAVGADGSMPVAFRTIDAGATWERRPISGADGPGLLLGVALVSEGSATAVGLRGEEGNPQSSLTVTTDDGGGTWEATTASVDALVLRAIARQP